MKDLNRYQRAALAFIADQAAPKQSTARQKAEELFAKEGVAIDLLNGALRSIATTAPIDVSFHPDRLDAGGVSVAQSLYRSGRYRNQFETGISNGGVTAFEGGERDLWETRLFGGAYQQPGAKPEDRPKYGALNLLNRWDGACPRFGCCYFRLNANVAKRATFAFGDSSTEPEEVSTIELFENVLVSTLETIHSTGRALGGKDLDVRSFLMAVAQQEDLRRRINFEAPPGRNLDECIEVHIHGPIDLGSDVQYLVVDGAFRQTPTGNLLIDLCTRYGLDLYWSPGFFLSTAKVPSDFRGPIMVPLAKHVAKNGVLDASAIGQAAASLRRTPHKWRDWGTFDETLQHLKQLWHILATFGEAGELN